MPNSAKVDPAPHRKHRVVFVVYPDISPMDLAGPLQVFSWAKDQNGALAYEAIIVSPEGGVVQSDTLMTIEAEPISARLGQVVDTLLVVGGDGVYAAAENAQFVDRLRALISRSKRVTSVCSGAYLLAAAGALDGRRATTHWEDIEALQADFPMVQVEKDPIYIRDGSVWTSAGVTAGTDMALALVAADLGPQAALDRAKALITYMVRPGGQSQFSPILERQRRDSRGRFDALHGWIKTNLKRDLRVDDLAEQENMSLRSFHRVYVATMGTTPAKAIEALRVEAARDLLESSRASVKVIAVRCGFRDAERMRRAFIKNLGVSPVAYRQRFNVSA